VPAGLALATAALVAAVQVEEPRLVPLALAAPLALGALVWLALRPRIALVSMLVYVPLQRPLLAYLYASGVPAPAVRYLGFYKELVVGSLILAALQAHRRSPRPWRRADALAATFVALAAVLVVVPAVLPGVLGNQPLFVLVAAFRLNCLFLIAFLACRRLSWTAEDLQALSKAAVVTALAMAAAVLWQAQDSVGFENFTVRTLQLPAYLRDVSGVTDTTTLSSVHNVVTSSGDIRAGGWLYDPLSLGFFMVLPVALAFRNLARRRSTPVAWVVAGLVGVTLVLTLTRSSVVAAVLSVLLLLLAAGRYRLGGRTKLLVATLLAVLVVAPFVGQSSLLARIDSAVQGKDVSAAEHASSSTRALEQLVAHPAGRGLGSNPVTATLEGTRSGITSENAYLQIGNELGVVPMLVFVLLVLVTQADLLIAARRRDDLSIEAVVWAAGWGLAFNGLFLHVWLSIPVALTFWSLAGAATSTPQPAAAEDVEQVGS
jgi:hypothetical protein